MIGAYFSRQEIVPKTQVVKTQKYAGGIHATW